MCFTLYLQKKTYQRSHTEKRRKKINGYRIQFTNNRVKEAAMLKY